MILCGMFRLYFCSAVLLVCSAVTTANSEVVPDPNRGLHAIRASSVDTAHMPFLVGGQAVVQWKDVEPEEGRYDSLPLQQWWLITPGDAAADGAGALSLTRDLAGRAAAGGR